jgi:hypothetical protein
MSVTLHEGTGSEQLHGRRLAKAMSDLLLDMADMVDGKFPPSPNTASEAHLKNYEAMRTAIAAVDVIVTGLPGDPEFRSSVLDYAVRAFQLTQGDPQHDDVVGTVIRRAGQDYKPDTPDELRRTKKADRKLPPKAGPK